MAKFTFDEADALIQKLLRVITPNSVSQLEERPAVDEIIEMSLENQLCIHKRIHAC